MVIFKGIADLQQYLNIQRKEGRKIGFVPTMGALHKGHVSLVEQAKTGADVVVTSIFVNPTQFNDKADLAKYPVTPEEDIDMLIEAGCDVLFMPTAAEIYPGGAAKSPTYNFEYLELVLEGAYRPGHFKGVGQVVARLLEIINANNLYIGQKDYQQCLVIKQLVAQLGKEADIEVLICPTIREADGLAMSSRNRRLTESQRAVAGVIYQCLVSIQSKNGINSYDMVQKECKELLTAKGFEPEYVALADADDLSLLWDYDPSRRMIALVAAKLGNVRLIDNLLL